MTSASDPELFTGFASPADDHEEPELNLHTLVVRNPPATYFLRAGSGELRAWGIRDGDLLVVDRAQPLRAGQLVIVAASGEFRLCELRQRGGRLVPQRPGQTETLQADELQIWGVVTHALHFLLPGT